MSAGRECSALAALAIAVLAAVCVGASPAAAAGGRWHLGLDNDFFNFWQKPNDRPDFGYTAGTDLSVQADHVPHLLAVIAAGLRFGAGSGATSRLELGLRQEIYSPWIVGGDPGYGGWLELRLGVRNESPVGLSRCVAHLGVTGPPSLAEQTQSMIHKDFGFDWPGWEHQLPFEPGVGVEYEGARQVLGIESQRGWAWTLAPAWRGRLGTYATDARLGTQTLLGLRPRPPWNESNPRSKAAAVYLIGCARLDAIARSEFLDGPLFESGRKADKLPFVGSVETGIGFAFKRTSLEWHVTRRQKDFRDQPAPHTYSSLVLSWMPAEANR